MLFVDFLFILPLYAFLGKYVHFIEIFDLEIMAGSHLLYHLPQIQVFFILRGLSRPNLSSWEGAPIDNHCKAVIHFIIFLHLP